MKTIVRKTMLFSLLAIIAINYEDLKKVIVWGYNDMKDIIHERAEHIIDNNI